MTGSGSPCVRDIAIHRGHLIAAQYKPNDSECTFKLGNQICKYNPQFGSVNSGGWNQCEQKMLKWADENYHGAHVYISSSGSYHQRMRETIWDLFVKQDSVIMMGHRGVRQRIGLTGLTWWSSFIQLHVVSCMLHVNTTFYAPNRPVINWQRRHNAQGTSILSDYK